MFVDIYVFIVQMQWIAGRRDLTWMFMDRGGLGGLFWMTGMGGRVEVVRIRIYRIMGDFQDCDDADASFYGYCLEASMTGPG